MESQTTRATAVRQALARRARTAYTPPELQVLTQYVLGHLTQQQANEQLRTLGLTLTLASSAASPQPA
ncbi:hypothetical protein HHL22_04040 [Hymenobacter sp. RP-2-7]|uniref:Uncharacterized protein n=1 Tax=Hymenobacter polaris TaxID=2682546 RepID=A0A7Y0ABN7_9BACT|nr:hypothetical protein [Hymenobacter polaris]NML64369.1 hypothetical protein [Hymenobacter polaris]